MSHKKRGTKRNSSAISDLTQDHAPTLREKLNIITIIHNHQNVNIVRDVLRNNTALVHATYEFDVVPGLRLVDGTLVIAACSYRNYDVFQLLVNEYKIDASLPTPVRVA